MCNIHSGIYRSADLMMECQCPYATLHAVATESVCRQDFIRKENGIKNTDLEEIIEKPGYLEELGVKGIWITPIFPSPITGFGYDVTGYTDIHPILRTMEDFDRLIINEIHDRGMKLIPVFAPHNSWAAVTIWRTEPRSAGK